MDAVSLVKNLGFELESDTYDNALSKIIIKDNEGYLYITSYNSLQQNHLPERFCKSNSYTIYNIKLWCKLNNKPFELISTLYVNSDREYLEWKCLKENCNQIFKAKWYAVICGTGCGVCDGRQVTISNCLIKSNPDIASEWHSTLNGALTPYDVTLGSNKRIWWQCSKNPKHVWSRKINDRKYNSCPYCAGQLASEDYNLLKDNPELCEEWNYERNKKTPDEYTPQTNQKVWWKCKECGHEWKASICSRNGRDKTGCNECFKSKGEIRIKEILDEFNIKYKREYIFDELFSDLHNPLRFDFAIFDNESNFKCLIEYDGEFHFKKYYKNQNFEILQYHDKLKNQYCKNNNFILIRIPYWQFNKLDNIIYKWLNKFNLIK